VEGRNVAHTMDPRLGRPVETRVASATVVAPDCRTADGLATALMVLPPDEGLALIRRLPDVDAAVMLVADDGFELRTTEGLAGHVQIVSDRVRAAD
ncbi:MAG: FAD:protein FMN transferase, partial [Myxococcota bacterium]